MQLLYRCDRADVVTRLEEYARLHNKDFLYARLAEVLVLSNKYSEAMTHYSTALRWYTCACACALHVSLYAWC